MAKQLELPADSLYGAFENTARKSLEKTALLYLGEKFSYRQFNAMVLSLAVAADEPDYPKKKTRVLKAVGSLCKRFEEEFGTTECRKLSGLDLTTPEGREVLKQRVKAETCRGYVDTCARILAEILPEA